MGHDMGLGLWAWSVERGAWRRFEGAGHGVCGRDGGWRDGMGSGYVCMYYYTFGIGLNATFHCSHTHTHTHTHVNVLKFLFQISGVDDYLSAVGHNQMCKKRLVARVAKRRKGDCIRVKRSR